MEISISISGYRSTGISEKEEQRLVAIEEVLDKYGTSAIVAERLYLDGFSAEAIDKKIAVDDTPAIEALKELGADVVAGRQLSTEKIRNEVARLAASVSTSSQFIAVLLVITTFLFLWLLRGRVIVPLGNMVNAFKAIDPTREKHTHLPTREEGLQDELDQVAVAGNSFLDAVDAQLAERSKAEHKMREAKEEAEQASLAKTQFLSSMSHELRTPLNSILGFAQLLESDDEDPLSEDQLDSVRQVLTSGTHLLSLVNDVLDFSRIESGQTAVSVEDVDVESLVEEAVLSIQAQGIKKGITIHDHVRGAESPYLKADYTRLKQVLLNLLSNAIKYNRDDGDVTLSLERRDGGKVRINVEDNGEGIAEDKLKLLFEPFERLGHENSTIEGTGIGLNIAQRLVEDMDGEIGVYSTPGEGATFWVEFDQGEKIEMAPDEESREPREPGEQEGVSATPAGVHKVLYVEDNPANMQLMRRILSRRPQYELLEATTAEDGIELALAEKPGIILMDIGLPGMDGYQALKTLRAEESMKDTPIIAVTANAMISDVAKGKEAGFHDYLTKPMEIGKLDEVLARAVESMEAFS